MSWSSLEQAVVGSRFGILTPTMSATDLFDTRWAESVAVGLNGLDAEFYHLYVRGASAIYPVIDYSSLPRSECQSQRSGYIINSNRYGWYWQVRAMVNGVWNDWTEVRHFDVEPLNTDCGG